MSANQALANAHLLLGNDPSFLTRITDPWTKLAAAYHLSGHERELDALRRKHPDAIAQLGELYAANKDWERALDAYGRLITPETIDAAL